MMKQNQWQILLVILLFMSVYVLFNSNMYNSILGRTILVITVIILTKYNIMLGLGLVILIIYMCPDAYSGYMEGMETATPPPTSDTSAMTKQATDMITQLMNSPGLSSLTAETNKKAPAVATPAVATPAVATPAVATPATTTESFTNSKKHYNSNQLSVDEKLRPKTSVTSKIYNRTSVNEATELLSENSSLGFSFLH